MSESRKMLEEICEKARASNVELLDQYSTPLVIYGTMMQSVEMLVANAVESGKTTQEDVMAVFDAITSDMRACIDSVRQHYVAQTEKETV